MDLIIVEPLRDFYKDEVRDIARLLEITSSERQPFPGPGLAVRVLGHVTPERVQTCRVACDIVERGIRDAVERGGATYPGSIWAALLPVRSVGVHGDARPWRDHSDQGSHKSRWHVRQVLPHST